MPWLRSSDGGLRARPRRRCRRTPWSVGGGPFRDWYYLSARRIDRCLAVMFLRRAAARGRLSLAPPGWVICDEDEASAVDMTIVGSSGPGRVR